MVATVVKSIGATGRAYSTIDAWCDAGPASFTTAERWTAGTFSGTFTQGETVTGTGLTTGKYLDGDGSSYVTFGISAGNSNTLTTLTGSSSGATCVVSSKTDTGIIWKGECYNDAEFSGAVTFPGITTSATCYFWLRPAAGHAFNDHANKLTNALRYDVSNGVGFRNTTHANRAMGTFTNHVLLEAMQIQNAPGGGGQVVFFSTTNLTVKQCIVEQQSAAAVIDANEYGTYINSVFMSRHATTAGLKNGTAYYYNCTFLRPTDLTTGGNCFSNYYAGYPLIKNCAVLGAYTTKFNGTLGSYLAGTSYNASDVASGSMPGSNNVASLTASNELTVVTDSTRDCRPKSGNSLGAGTRDATNTGDIDILGQSRSLTTPTIGAMEWVVAGATSFVPRRGGAKFSNLFSM